jgi:hypothetical protein
MTPLRLVLGAGLALALIAPPALAAPAAKPAPPAAADSEVEPEAVQALTRMSAFLGTLTAFDISADTSLDLVTTDGQKVKLDGVTRYTVRRPDAFVVDMATSLRVRRLIYDGKTLTLYAPELGYYARVDAPGTIRETLEAADERYGLHVPLQDLFRWTDPSRRDTADSMQSGMALGPTKVDGLETEQYAFREGQIDWQIWIQKGDRPIPLKIVIVDRSDEARPQYEARLHWNLAPQLTSATFAFQPAADVKLIKLTTLKP